MSAATLSGIRGLRPAQLFQHYRWPVVFGALLLSLAVFLAVAPLKWAALGLIAAALVVAVFLEPVIALLAIAVLIPWGGLVDLPLPFVGAVDLLVGLTIVAWLAREIAVRREVRLRMPALTVSLLAFVWVAALSLTRALSWRDGLPEWLKWAEFAALYIVAAQLLGPRSRWFVVAALFVGGLSQAALGAYQFLFRVGPEGFILPGTSFMRAFGTLEQPNPYAGYLGYTAPLAASLALAAILAAWRQRSARLLLLGVALSAVAAALAGGILMSWSRGAWLGLAAALVAVAGLRNWRTAVATGALVGALALALGVFGTAWLPAPIEGRVADLGAYFSVPDPARTEINDENFSVLERLAHWDAGWRMFSDSPWLGVGIGNYGVSYARYPQPHWYEPLGHAHNVFINFLGETGILGLTAFLAFWLSVARLAWRTGWSAGSRWNAALALGVLGAWAYLTVHSLFDNLFVQHLQLQLALLLAALQGAGKRDK
jgi:O-antigen ligase